MKIKIFVLLDWVDDGIDGSLSLLEMYIHPDKLISEIGSSSYILLILLIKTERNLPRHSKTMRRVKKEDVRLYT